MCEVVAKQATLKSKQDKEQDKDYKAYRRKKKTKMALFQENEQSKNNYVWAPTEKYKVMNKRYYILRRSLAHAITSSVSNKILGTNNFKSRYS